MTTIQPSMSIKRLTIKQIYKDFSIPYDVRAARKFLDLDKSVSKTAVNIQLKELHALVVENTEPIYSYTMRGLVIDMSSTQKEDKNGNKIFNKERKPIYNKFKRQLDASGNVMTPFFSDYNEKEFSYTFQSKNKYNLKPFNLLGDDDKPVIFQNNKPTYTKETIMETKMIEETNAAQEFRTYILSNGKEITNAYTDMYRFIDDFTKKTAVGAPHYSSWETHSIIVKKININNRMNLKDVPLFFNNISVPESSFNGFKDKGIGFCVPETILHHITQNNRNKKMTLEKVIDKLEEAYTDDDGDDDDDEFPIICDALGEAILNENGFYIHYTPEEWKLYLDTLTDEEELPDEDRGKRGYTSDDVIRVLEFYKINSRIVDVNHNTILKSDGNIKCDKNLKAFMGLAFNHHLYYCDNQALTTSFNNARNDEKEKQNLLTLIEEGDVKIKETRNIVKNQHNLNQLYIEMCNENNTTYKVRTCSGNIVSIYYSEGDDKVAIIANPECDIMTKMLGENFTGFENTVSYGRNKFMEYFPDHKTSQFTKNVLDNLHKHGNIVECLNIPDDKLPCFEIDFNKCRTSILIDNKLGDWDTYNASAYIQDYEKTDVLRAGMYYIELLNEEQRYFFARGNSWYSKQFIDIGAQEGFEFVIKYQLLSTGQYAHDYYKDFVLDLIEKYPDNYKKLINAGVIGYFGKTQEKKMSGYIEADEEMAVSSFLKNNIDELQYIDDDDYEIKKQKIITGKSTNIHNININETDTHYIVETTEYNTIYDNDLPVYNKILEGEYLKLYNLKVALNGKIIKIKTDCVVVQGKFNKLEYSNEIGGISITKSFTTRVDMVKNVKLNYDYIIDTNIIWDINHQQPDGSFKVPQNSFLITAKAGYGKSYTVRNLPEYADKKTLRLGFTNLAAKNISQAGSPAYTLNTKLGINCLTGKMNKNKLKELADIKCIIITEVFMTPSYIMKHLMNIKMLYPHIKFICEGDDGQTRPVGEEEINWLNTKLLFDLCDGNRVILNINRRNNETDNYVKLQNGERLSPEKYDNDRLPQEVNICYTNKMRVSINDEKMNKNDYFMAKNKTNEFSQDIYINLDTPIMCIKSEKKLGLFNGYFYKLSQIKKDKITIEGCNKEFTDVDFTSLFVVCYAFTNHKIQGCEFDYFNIYEWGLMDDRMKYTAYSRTKNGINVKMNETKKHNSKLWNELLAFFN